MGPADPVARHPGGRLRRAQPGRHARRAVVSEGRSLIGEVERYEHCGGQPLAFHSGYYQVTARHLGCV